MTEEALRKQLVAHIATENRYLPDRFMVAWRRWRYLVTKR